MARARPNANSRTVAAASQGSTRLTSVRKRVGLARSITAIGSLLIRRAGTGNGGRRQNMPVYGPDRFDLHYAADPYFHWQTDHSRPWRSAAAAATGPSTRLAKDRAQRMVKGGPNGAGPIMAALAAATPKISTGIVSGSTNTASSKPPRPSATDSAAPISPMKVSAGVPASNVSATVPMPRSSTLSMRPSTGVITISGNAVVSQCAMAFAATANSSGMRPIIKMSSDPSS